MPHPSGARLRIAFAGTPEFAVPALHALLGRHTVVGVLTQPDRPAGRGRELTASPVKVAALAAGLPVAQPPTLKTGEGHTVLEAWQPEVLVVVAYGLILPPPVLELPRLGCINIHASLLPRWRGAAPIQRAILAGDAETGVSIMRLEAGLDTGPVYLERRVPIAAQQTAGALQEELAALGAQALLEALAGIAAGTLFAQPQSPQGATYAPKIEKSAALIDWSRSAAEIDRQVRAFDPWPVAETRFAGEQLRIHRARPFAGPAPGTVPGDAAFDEPQGLRVRCGNGALAVLELQRPGRRRVPAAELGRTLRDGIARFG
ncbi:MAG: methionyl-tRNA formyltransferase, partial [Steroidobacteraceae bacterium]